ncbi:hypothetical protein THAOC_09048 [Thalassiosira oceanica]|uniref:Uncharacterized protein n=1 Tax=Thalassiosira oceanica TaxID=159749 RepID=K0TGU6_THAOC|nr:hypothetical protein THAOC_09048 [Thalassiosira oceanica]|mmetsp:Transcript_2943/g.5837  ORF Transcript_2943/g.5837 Transcript_2943/m.5837 type:complete len:135 (-) Transcript_2943:256-660(-)|eukprot:EJK69672.1 hypothetical protein THAOC_09048 [Thalassiosira oceanica]
MSHVNNCRRPLARLVTETAGRRTGGPRPRHQPSPPLHCCYSSSPPSRLAMKPGTIIPGLDKIYAPSKDKAAEKGPVVLPREEYPAWVGDLARPLPTLAKLRSMEFSDATDKEMMRYLKLTRRVHIKELNGDSAK